MEARIGTLAVGTRIITLLSGREGRVVDTADDGVQVAFEVEVKVLHPEVVVRVVERVH